MSQIPPGMLLRVINNKEDIIASYTVLTTFAPDEEARGMVNVILEEEKAHLSMFTSLYQGLFGDEPSMTGGTANIINSYTEGLKSAVLSEFFTYSLYGNIIFTDSDQAVRDVFRRAVFDENIHSTRFNFLISSLPGGITAL